MSPHIYVTNTLDGRRFKVPTTQVDTANTELLPSGDTKLVTYGRGVAFVKESPARICDMIREAETQTELAFT